SSWTNARASFSTAPCAIRATHLSIAMALLEWLIVAAAAFGGLVALMYVMQRSLMYFPERLHTPPAMGCLPQAQQVALDTEDGERVIVWHVARRGEKPVVLYFHGNGGAHYAIVLLAFMRSLQMVTDSSRSATADTAVRPDARPRLG